MSAHVEHHIIRDHDAGLRRDWYDQNARPHRIYRTPPVRRPGLTVRDRAIRQELVFLTLVVCLVAVLYYCY